MVKYASSLFDPLGIVAPVHFKAKIFIQKLWSMNIKWDEPLNVDLNSEWSNISSDMDTVRSIRIKRQFSTSFDKSKAFELHVFADANMKAYGAVVYLKQGDSVAFVISKSRVKPLKSITLPRLELLAAVVGTQLLKLVLKALGSINIQHTTLWCDSQIVLCWIQSGKKMPIFVENNYKRGSFYFH